MEVNSVRCCDTAALVALINMLKVNLGSTPEIYNTLLAVLCDFDPCKHGNRDRTVRYIRLLVTDKVLANCLLMSLPQGAAELQDLPLYTGSLPDMKRAIRHKFLGMKVSVKSPQARSEEKSKEPVNVTNQNITIIVTDQDEAKSTSVEDTYNHSILQTESSLSDQGNDGTGSKSSSSQTKCIITFTKSSLSGLGKDSLASVKSSVSVDSSASRATQSGQPASVVKSGNQSGNMIEHSVSSVRSMLESQSQPSHVSGAKVSGTESYSKLDNLITLVKSRTEGKSNVLQDCTTGSIQGHTTNVTPSQAYQGGKKNYPLPWSDQQFSQNQKLNVPLNTHPRLPNPLVPLVYQQYAYPIPGGTSYQSCVTGYTANPMLPWTPLTYIPGYNPNQHYPVRPTLQFCRPSSTSGSDATLDLSIQKKPYSQSQSSQNENKRNIQANNETNKGEKRCASASCIPYENKDQKQKVRRLSTDVPIFSATRYVPTIKEDAMKSQSFPATASNTDSYLCLADNRERRDGNQPNSLQALQELTFRINANTGVQSTSSVNPSIPRKSLSTGSFSDSWQQLRLYPGQNSNLTGMPHITNVASSLEALKRYSVPSTVTQKLLLPSNTFTAAANSLTKIPQVSASKQSHVATRTARNDNIITTCIQPKPDQIQRETTLVQQEPNCTISPRSSAIVSSSVVQNQKAVENVTVIRADVKQKSSACLRSFPYSQHIQLPDGNVSVVDFPALLSQNTTHSARTPLPTGKMDTKSHEPSNLNFQSGIVADNVKTSCGARLDKVMTDGNMKDCTSRYSLYLKRGDTSNETAEKVSSETEVSADSQSNAGETEHTKSNETCLIIETTSENGTEQVQFKLDKKSSANLLGELLKLKPGTYNSAADQIAGNSRDSQLNRSELYKGGHALPQSISVLDSDGRSSHPTRSILNNDVQRISDDDIYTPMECYETLSENIESGQGRHTKTKYSANSEQESTFSSLNVSPYLLGMLPDTTTFTEDDDDDEEQEEYSDCDDGDDDVFLHPIF